MKQSPCENVMTFESLQSDRCKEKSRARNKTFNDKVLFSVQFGL